MENFWSLFKRALKGTYVSVEPFHLDAYVKSRLSGLMSGRKMTARGSAKCLVQFPVSASLIGS
jgi:hypothetical protein